jgi:hypothetical protein
MARRTVPSVDDFAGSGMGRQYDCADRQRERIGTSATQTT